MTFVELFSSYTFKVVTMGCVLLGVISGIVGSFAVVKKQGLIGDGISHSTLPGVVLAFLIIGVKDTQIMLIGALIAGLLSAALIFAIVKNSRVKFDSALAVVMSVMFGFGTLLLSYSQKLPNANQAGLKNYIYGQAANMLSSDVETMLVVGVIVLVIVLLFWKEMKLVSFDLEYAITMGYNVSLINGIMILLLVLAIIIGLQTVGVILMSAMIISPAVAARQWTNKFSMMVILSAIFGATAGILGSFISITDEKLATGPIVVVVATMIAIISILISPKRGIVYKLYQRKKNKKELEKRFDEKRNDKIEEKVVR